MRPYQFRYHSRLLVAWDQALHSGWRGLVPALMVVAPTHRACTQDTNPGVGLWVCVEESRCITHATKMKKQNKSSNTNYKWPQWYKTKQNVWYNSKLITITPWLLEMKSKPKNCTTRIWRKCNSKLKKMWWGGWCQIETQRRNKKGGIWGNERRIKRGKRG